MSIKFEMNGDWEGNIRRAIDDGMKSFAGDTERALNSLRPTWEGRPIAEARAAVDRKWRQATDNGQLGEPHLTEFAEAIQSGRPIKIEYSGLR